MPGERWAFRFPTWRKRRARGKGWSWYKEERLKEPRSLFSLPCGDGGRRPQPAAVGEDPCPFGGGKVGSSILEALPCPALSTRSNPVRPGPPPSFPREKQQPASDPGFPSDKISHVCVSLSKNKKIN